MHMGAGGGPANSASGLLTYQNMVNRPFKYHRSFTSGDLPATFSQTPAAQDLANGWRSGWSFVCNDNTRATAIASGQYDNRIRNFIQSIPLNAQVDWTFAHEANAKLDTTTLANQTAAFQRAASLMRQFRDDGMPQVVSGNVNLVLCLTNWNWYQKTAPTYTRYDPVIAEVDMLTIDIYGGLLAPNYTWAIQMDTLLRWWYDEGGKDLGTGRIGLWETSANDSERGIAAKEKWITDCVKGFYDNGGEVFAAFAAETNGSQNFFNRQEYADLYATLIDQYGGDPVPPPPPPPPPPPGPDPEPPVYVPRRGTYSYQSWK